MMYEEKWGEIVTDWLMEDYALKKKLLRNNKNIFEQLQKFGWYVNTKLDKNYRGSCLNSTGVK